MTRKTTLLRGPLIGLFLGLVFIGLGILLTVSISGGAARDAEMIAASYAPDAAAWQAVGTDELAALQGTASGTPDENGHVASVTDRLVSRTTGSGESQRRQHYWEPVTSNFVLVGLAISGDDVLLTTQSSLPGISGEADEIIDQSGELAGRLDVYQYKGTELAEGARRTVGIREGDTISVLGRKTGSGDMIVIRAHVGDVASFEQAVGEEQAATSIFGYVFGGLGVLVTIISVLALVRNLRAKPATGA
jgi:hypothetical protein